MTKRERFNKVFPILEIKFQKPITALDYKTPYQLLIAVILSAQCTDVRVNIVTKELYKVVKGPEDLANMSIKEIERYIKSTGFYRNKAKNIKLCSEQLIERHNGEVPNTMEDLRALAGVGRKTANVILGNIYHQPSIVVDTHVKRISKRLGLAKAHDPEKIEYELQDVLPKDHWTLYNMHVISFGRTICTARSPKCAFCFLQDICEAKENGK